MPAYKDSTGVLRECSDGHILCPDCDGDGTVECQDCGGSGEWNCDLCNGSGSRECDLGHDHECDDCEGSGRVSCGSCESGLESCYTCGRSGEVLDPDQETDEGL